MTDGDRERDGGEDRPRREVADAAREEEAPDPDDPASPDEDTARDRGDDVGDAPRPRDGVVPALRWLRESDDEWVVFGRELVKSAAAVAGIALLLFAISGVWPPMVAVESGSMQPNMQRGDLVFVVEEHRFSGGSAVAGTGVVPYQVATDSGYRKFGDYGDVLVFAPPSRGGSPIIHRARMYVEAGENWIERANASYTGGRACGESRSEGLPSCPAPYDGFITKGDNNAHYDQVQGISAVVRPSWIRGRAMVRVPWLGHVRLLLSSVNAAENGTVAA